MPPIRFHGAALGCRDQGLPERMRQNARRKGRGKALLEAHSRPLVLLVSPSRHAEAAISVPCHRGYSGNARQGELGSAKP